MHHPRWRGWEWVFPVLAVALVLAPLKGLATFIINLLR